MRSTIAFALFWLNLIVTSLVIYFAITSKNRYSYDSYSGRYSYHLRGTKQKLLESNPKYKLTEEDALLIYQKCFSRYDYGLLTFEGIDIVYKILSEIEERADKL